MGVFFPTRSYVFINKIFVPSTTNFHFISRFRWVFEMDDMLVRVDRRMEAAITYDING